MIQETTGDQKLDSKSMPILSPQREHVAGGSTKQPAAETFQSEFQGRQMNLRSFGKIDPHQKEYSQISDLVEDQDNLIPRNFKRIHKRSMSEEGISKNYMKEGLGYKQSSITEGIDKLQQAARDGMLEEALPSLLLVKPLAPAEMTCVLECSSVVSKPKITKRPDPRRRSPIKKVTQKKEPTQSQPPQPKKENAKAVPKQSAPMDEEILATASTPRPTAVKQNQDNTDFKNKKKPEPKAKPPIQKTQPKQTPEVSSGNSKENKLEKPLSLNATEILAASKNSQKPTKNKPSAPVKEVPAKVIKKTGDSSKTQKQTSNQPAVSKQQKKEKAPALVTPKEPKQKVPAVEKMAIESLLKPMERQTSKDQSVKEITKKSSATTQKATLPEVLSPKLGDSLEKADFPVCGSAEEKECKQELQDVSHHGISNLTVDHETKPIDTTLKPEISGVQNLDIDDFESLSRKFLKKLSKEIQKCYEQESAQAEKTAKMMEERIRNALQSDEEMNKTEQVYKVNYTAKLIELIKKIKGKEVDLSFFVRKEEPEETNKVKVNQHS